MRVRVRVRARARARVCARACACVYVCVCVRVLIGKAWLLRLQLIHLVYSASVHSALVR